MFDSRGAAQEVLVDGPEPGQHLGELPGTDGHHQREADRRVVGVATAHPVPELEHVGRVDPELGHPLLVGRHRHEVPGHRLGSGPHPVEQPTAGRRRVGHGLERREGLRAHHEQGPGRVQVLGLGPQVDRVDVRDETVGDAGLGVVGQGLGRHGRPEVRSPDPDVDHRGDPLAGVPGPRPRADPVGQVAHLGQHPVDVGHHVLAVDHQMLARRHAQGHVEHGAVLGRVDVAPGEHGVTPFGHAGPTGDRGQQAQGLGSGPVLGIVQVEVGRVEHHRGAPVRLGLEELLDGGVTQPGEMGGQCSPLLGGGDVDHVGHGASLSRRDPGPAVRNSITAG